MQPQLEQLMAQLRSIGLKGKFLYQRTAGGYSFVVKLDDERIPAQQLADILLNSLKLSAGSLGLEVKEVE